MLMRSMRRWARIGAGGLGVVVLVAGLVLVAFSPLALGILERDDGRDWQRLSEIGQTYGAVSALLSALALAGVAVSLVLQSRAASLDRLYAHRQQHLELIRMAMDDPELDAVWVDSVPVDPTERRQRIYCTQVFLWWEMAFEVGAISEEWARGAADSMFRGAVGRR